MARNLLVVCFADNGMHAHEMNSINTSADASPGLFHYNEPSIDDHLPTKVLELQSES
jgi:hypothetical protein